MKILWTNLASLLPLYILLLKSAYHDHCTHRILNTHVEIIALYAMIFGYFLGDIYIFSACILLGAMLILPKIVSFLLKRDIFLGSGDIKLMSVSSLFLPPEDLGVFLCCMGFTGVMYQRIYRKNPIPFAPAIAISIFCITLWRIFFVM